MKLRNLMLTATSAAVAYWVVSKKDRIQQEATETKHLIDDAKESYQSIQDQLAILQSYKTPLQEMLSDLQYKTTVFQKETETRLKEIQTIQQKYLTPKPSDNKKS